MQVSLNIQDDLYQKALSGGIDIQSKFNEYIKNLVEKKQFQENKIYFEDALNDIENGKDELLTQDQYDDEMNSFIKSL